MHKRPIYHQNIFVCTIFNRIFLVCTQTFLPSLKEYIGLKPFPGDSVIVSIESKMYLYLIFTGVCHMLVEELVRKKYNKNKCKKLVRCGDLDFFDVRNQILSKC